MSDLTRRVLDWASANADEHGCFYPMLVMATAAPDLARQVEAVEALADELERLATWERTPPAGPPTPSPYADGLDVAAARIRDALNDAD